MSKCTICNTPLRFGKRSGNTIDVERIRTGNMVCYGCHPHIPPIRNRSYYVFHGLLLGLVDIRRLKIKCRRQISIGRELQRYKNIEKKSLKKKLRRQAQIDLFPPGVYGIWRNDELIYVGESKKIWSRIYNGHFRIGKSKHKKPSPIELLITPHNSEEFKWGYLVYEEEESKRISLETQYIARYAPRYNYPNYKLEEHEHKSIQTYLHSMDMGMFTIDTKKFYTPVERLMVLE